MKDFLELASERYSVRDFSPKAVEEEKLRLILEAGKVAPTAVNYQPQTIYVIRTPEAMGKLSALRPMFGAPLALLICYDDSRSWKNSRDAGHDSGEVDAAIVTSHMMLEAWELGVGSCWIGAFSPVAVKEAFGIPDNQHPVAILALGYASDQCQPSERHSAFRPFEDMVKEL